MKIVYLDLAKHVFSIASQSISPFMVFKLLNKKENFLSGTFGAGRWKSRVKVHGMGRAKTSVRTGAYLSIYLYFVVVRGLKLKRATVSVGAPSTRVRRPRVLSPASVSFGPDSYPLIRRSLNLNSINLHSCHWIGSITLVLSQTISIIRFIQTYLQSLTILRPRASEKNLTRFVNLSAIFNSNYTTHHLLCLIINLTPILIQFPHMNFKYSEFLIKHSFLKVVIK